MRYYFLLLFTAILTSSLVAGRSIKSIEGTYQGENILIMFDNGDNHCEFNVYCNGDLIESTSDDSITIKLDFLRIGEAVNLEFKSSGQCRYVVVNPKALLSESKFEVVKGLVKKDKFTFKTSGEYTQQKLLVEKFRNNKWVKISELQGAWKEGSGDYEVKVNHHSGLNKYRVKQICVKNKYRFSKEFKFISDQDPLLFPDNMRVTKEIDLPREADYEIFSSLGALVSKGSAKSISVTELKTGIYFLNIDNKTFKFSKR